MAAGPNRRISAASARSHTRKPKPKTPKSSGIFKKILLVFFVGFLAWAYQATRPPPPKTCGSTDGPPVTSSRIQLKDGRFLAYKEYGVPKDNAKHKIVFVHGFDSCRHDVSPIITHLSPDLVESEGIYVVSFDRPGYGESDPHPTRTVKSIAFDIEELADQLGLGSKFYVIGFSMGGQIVWTCLKYIPHRLAGAALLAPVVNYWWPGVPSNMSNEAFKQQLPQDQWALRVAHYMPWLTYWWNSQKLFPGLSLIGHSLRVLSRQDMELVPKIRSIREEYQVMLIYILEYSCLYRKSNIWSTGAVVISNLSFWKLFFVASKTLNSANNFVLTKSFNKLVIDVHFGSRHLPLIYSLVFTVTCILYKIVKLLLPPFLSQKFLIPPSKNVLPTQLPQSLRFWMENATLA